MNTENKKSRLGAALLGFTLANAVMLGHNVFDEPPENPPPKLRIAAGMDDRLLLSTAPGSPFSSIGMAGSTDGGSGCTASYQGNGVAISAAHCFQNVAKASPDAAAVVFYIKKMPATIDTPITTVTFEEGGFITEIAIPQGYAQGTGKAATTNNPGYDIAFIKLVPMDGARLPRMRFPLQETIHSRQVSQAGYSHDMEGLGADFNCGILPQDQWQSPYTISADCAALPGASGGPLLDAQNRLIGIATNATYERKTGIILKTNFTPITPGLKQAFEQFKNGTLKGKMETLQNGIRLIKFPYERVPVKIQTPVPVV